MLGARVILDWRLLVWICHDKSSPHYEKTKNFTPFNSMDECVKSGGKPPKK